MYILSLKCILLKVLSFELLNSLFAICLFACTERVICFIESPLKAVKKVFCFILKALFVSKIFKLLS